MKARARRSRDAGDPALPWAVLLCWAGTEATGAQMLRSFVHRGGLDDETVSSSYAATLFANFALGTAGISLWALFLGTRRRSLAHAAFGQFLVTNLVGTALAVPWHRAQRTGQPTPEAGGEPAFCYGRHLEIGHAVLAWGTVALAGVAAFRPSPTRKASPLRRAG